MRRAPRLARHLALPLCLSLVLALAAGACRGKKEPVESGEARAEGAPPGNESRGNERTPAPASSASPAESEPFSIDPEKEEAIRTGTPAERLAAKYELLVERIMLEKAENVFSVDRAVNQGLVPLAREHNRLKEEGEIDTELTLEFARLAQFILAQHIYSKGDPFGKKAKAHIARIRAMIPEHEKKP